MCPRQNADCVLPMQNRLPMHASAAATTSPAIARGTTSQSPDFAGGTTGPLAATGLASGLRCSLRASSEARCRCRSCSSVVWRTVRSFKCEVSTSWSNGCATDTVSKGGNTLGALAPTSASWMGAELRDDELIAEIAPAA